MQQLLNIATGGRQETVARQQLSFADLTVCTQLSWRLLLHMHMQRACRRRYKGVCPVTHLGTAALGIQERWLEQRIRGPPINSEIHDHTSALGRKSGECLQVIGFLPKEETHQVCHRLTRLCRSGQPLSVVGVLIRGAITTVSSIPCAAYQVPPPPTPLKKALKFCGM